MAADMSDEVRLQLRQSLHDFNNVLGLILGFAGLLVRDLKSARASNPALEGMLDKAQEILAAAVQGEAVVKKMAAVVRSTPTAESARAESEPDAAAARRILFAGTEASGTNGLAEAFQRLGWTIEVQPSGGDALRAFRARPEDYAAVIAEQGTSELGGPELIDALKALVPGVRCALLLAADDPTDPRAGPIGQADLLRKLPLPVEELVAVAHRLVHGGARKRG